MSYRNRAAEKFCNFYGLVSGQKYTGGIESDISTVLSYSAVHNWLKVGGNKIAVLITWTVFKCYPPAGFRKGNCLMGEG